MTATLIEVDALQLESSCAVYRHYDGSLTYIVVDTDPSNPRTDTDCNVATLVQMNPNCLDIDSWSAFLWQLRRELTETAESLGVEVDAFVAQYMVQRGHTLYWDNHWSAGNSHGFGYVTSDAWVTAMGSAYTGHWTPKDAFESELKVYTAWASGEVYGFIHVSDSGSDACFGFLGYDSLEDIAAQATAYPIKEYLL